MSDVFVVRNQLGQYWGRKKRWVDGRKPRRILHTPHRDEAVNLLVELSARDMELRGEVLDASLDGQKVLQVEPSAHHLEDPDDMPKPAAGEDSGDSSGDSSGDNSGDDSGDNANDDSSDDSSDSPGDSSGG